MGMIKVNKKTRLSFIASGSLVAKVCSAAYNAHG